MKVEITLTATIVATSSLSLDKNYVEQCFRKMVDEKFCNVRSLEVTTTEKPHVPHEDRVPNPATK